MMVIPAIDLMSCKVVRLTRGDPATAKYYEQWGPPVQVALKWKAEGARRLHVIDLDATFSIGNNLPVIKEIAEAATLPIQVGGGIRTVQIAEKVLRAGVSQVILGTLAFNESNAIAKLQEDFSSESIIVAMDNAEGRVMMNGWKTPTAFTVWDALEKFVNLGVTNFLITSITRDGMLQGPDLQTLSEACGYPGAKIIAAGGIGSLGDLVALKQVGVEGVVVGKALYEEKFTLKQAIETVEKT